MLIQNEGEKIYSIGEYDTEADAASDVEELDEDEEICVEFIANDDSYDESDNIEYDNMNSFESKNNEYQDVDFLESEDD